MPTVNPGTIAFYGSAASLVVQAFKGAIPEGYHKQIPVVLMFVLAAIGAGISLSYGNDPVAGAFEGLFGAGAAVGLYQMARGVVPSVVNGTGWLKLKQH